MLKNYQILIERLNEFIQKYYWNRIVKGFFLFLTGFIFSLLFFVFIEYFVYFKAGIRSFIFLFLVVGNTFSFGYLVLLPFLSLLKLGRHLSFDQAAVVIGKHFRNDVDDKILNTLQLKKFLEGNPENFELISASIEQKSSSLQSFNFPSIIRISDNLKYLFIFLIGFLVMLSGWFVLPNVFKEPARRLVNYDIEFEKPAPFSVNIVTEFPVIVNRFDPLYLEIEVEGSVLPSDFVILVNGKQHKMIANRSTFSYEFRSVSDDFTFQLKSGKYFFGPYNVSVTDKPVIKNFLVDLDYPGYMGMDNETLNNTGDIIVPVGTQVNWNIFTEDADFLLFHTDKAIADTIDLLRRGVFKTGILAESDFRYRLIAGSYESDNFDTLNYLFRAVPDNYPEIRMEEFVDSVIQTSIFYRGLISDDYGFSALNFYYRVNDDVTEPDEFNKNDLNFDPLTLNQNFYYQVDLTDYDLNPGNTIEYFFEVTDNDEYSGYKSSRSDLYSFSVPSLNELLAESISSDENLNSGISESSEELNNIQEEIDDLRRKMLESESVTWEQREVLNELLEKQNNVEKKIEELQRANEQQNKRSNEFRQQDQNILEKQAELEKLFEEVLSDDLKELYKQIQDELEKLNKEEYFDILDKMEFEIEDIESKLDRALQLFKQLQVERLLSESINLLESLQSEQEALNDSVLSNGLDLNSEPTQEDLNSDFEDLREMLKEMADKNEELDRPNDLSDTSEQQEEIADFMEKALESIKNSNPSETNQNQKGASGKMQELKNQLMEMQSSMQQDNLAEDVNTLREILDNLITTSFNQENLMEEFNDVNVRDPKYFNLIQNQRKIENDLILIKDSLTALAKRQVQIQSIVSREIAEINLNIEVAIDHLIERRKHTAVSRQQFVMTHINNLALLLNESLNNMQNQMQAQGQSGGEPQKGEGASGMQDLRQMQEQMNQMLEQLRQGHQPMPGESGQSGMSLSEQLARMAAEQEAIRNRLGEIMEDYRNSGESTGELNELMKEMERTELDIVSNRVTRQTQMRQERILSRLLEHERALMEREKEERRVGETAKFYELSNPEDFFKYNIERLNNREVLRNLPPDFNAHYRSLVEKYFLNVQE